MLDEERAGRVAAMAAGIAVHYGQPHDIEWAIDTNGRLWLLQARPMTALPEPITFTAPGPRRHPRRLDHRRLRRAGRHDLGPVPYADRLDTAAVLHELDQASGTRFDPHVAAALRHGQLQTCATARDAGRHES